MFSNSYVVLTHSVNCVLRTNSGKYKFHSTLITCPNCRALSHIKEKGNVDALPSAFQFNNVIEWINKKQVKTNRVCREHGVQLNFFCLNCLQFVCGDGLRLTENHEEHTTLYVKTEAEPIRKAAQDMMEEIGCQLGHWKKAHEEVEAMISSIDDDTLKSIQLLDKYTEEIKRSLISAQDRLKETIMNTQKRKIQLLEKDKDAIMTKIQEIEKKISEHKVSMKNADSFETFIEYVAITEIHEFCADELPDTTQVAKQTKQDSLDLSPNFISLKRLKKDIAHFGEVHKKSEKSFTKKMYKEDKYSGEVDSYDGYNCKGYNRKSLRKICTVLTKKNMRTK